MNKFFKGFITGALFVYAIVSYALFLTNKNQKEFDYNIELDENSIYIETKYGEERIIHADSLEEFIIQDNL